MLEKFKGKIKGALTCFKNKKAQALTFSNLPEVFIVVGVGAIIGAITLNVLSSIGEDFTADSLEANATTNAQSGIANITAKYPLLGTVIGSVVILSAVVAGFAFFARRNQ